jgi:hypothetical protein
MAEITFESWGPAEAPGADVKFESWGPQIGRAEATGRSIAQGATANLYDEVVGLAAAGGRQSDTEPLGLGNIIRGGYRKLTGDQEAQARYQAAVDKERGVQKAVEEQYPITSTVGQIGGAVATLPVGFGARAATLGGRMAGSALTGAGYGGVAGFGAGEGTDDSLSKAATGAAIGGTVGAVAPPLIEGAGKVISAAARPVTSAVRGLVNPEKEASRRVVGALERDMRTGGQGLAPAEFQAAKAQGAPVAIADMGGNATGSLARSAANTSPEARSALEGVTSRRFGEQGERTVDFLKGISTAGNTTQTRDALKQAAQAANAPAYQKALQAGDRPIWSPEIERLVESPEVAAAMRAAVDKGKNRAVADGIAFKPDVPNLQFWDYTKRALDDGANAAKRAGRNDEASVLGKLSQQLRRELDNHVPEYRTARAGAARFFGAEDALEAGENFVSRSMSPNVAKKALAKMTPAERQLFQHGYSSKLVEQLENVSDRQNILGKLGQSTAQRQKLEIAFGPQQARGIEAFLHRENVMDKLRTAVSGNSTTARQLTELGLAGGIGGAQYLASGDPKSAMTSALVYGLMRGNRAIDQRVAQRVGQMLASDNPQVLAQGIKAVAGSKSLTTALKNFSGKLAGRTGGQQGAGLPTLQGPMSGRATDEQDQE